MAKNSKFWLGEGVININGKDYGAEMPLPVDEINSADLKKMEKDGRIGAKIAPVGVVCAECAALKIQVAELESDNERLTGELEEATKPAEKPAKKEKDGKK